MLKYGAKWPDEIDPLDIEFGVIRKGGTWTDSQGQKCGNGLFFHYREAQRLLWPTGEDHHRWSDLMLKTILEERITVCAGSKDSGKTHTALSRFGLTDYFCFPDETLILMSSTDLRGLQLRVWGDVKDLLRRAKELRPWLAGNVVESKHAIFTDALGEDCDTRDMRKGIICIPCLDRVGAWTGGLEKFVGIKQRRRRLLGDEIQFMHKEYLTVLANLDKGEFKGVFSGNMLPQKAMDVVAEPECGWDSFPEPTKTTTCRNKYGGVTIFLVGTDSPNFDVPADKPAPYPYLIDRQDEERVRKRHGPDSMEYWSQIKGVRKSSMNAHRVLTKEDCVRFGAFEKCIWFGDETTKIFSMDAAYGGDRAVGGHIEFGKETPSEQIIIKVHPPKEIPIALSIPETPEEQLAMWAKTYCDREKIPFENVFFDAGMRATLAVQMSRILSPAVNAVNFGGSATARPMSNDDYIFDEETKGKRLKRCDEAYSKFVTELWFSFRLAVMSKQVRELPEDVAQEFYMREWIYVKGDKYELETKDETKQRMGCSPDLADWCVIATEGARRLGFSIERMRDPSEVKEDDDWLERELQKYQKQMKERELTYR